MRRPALLLLAAAMLAAGCGSGDRGASGAPVATTAAPAGGTETAVAAGGTAVQFQGRIWPIGTRLRKRMRWSWRPGCPVGLEQLRMLRFDYWGFDRRAHHNGSLIVHRDHARRVLAVMEKLFRARYRIQRVRLVDDYAASDDRSVAANNTSGFNCRRVAGSSSWSEHAFGRAIDLNPLRNPYVTPGGRVSPPAGRPYAHRALRATGMVHGGDLVVRAFAAAGWKWGGYWSGSKDYQHFSATGR